MGSGRIKEVLRLDLDIKDFEKACEELAEKIDDDHFKPDSLVAASRGGLTIGRYISDLFGIQDLKVIRPELYRVAGQPNKKVVIKQDIPRRAIKYEKILFLDDVSDSGRTTEKCFHHLWRKKHPIQYLFRKDGEEPEDIKIATLYIKDGTIFVPHYNARKTDSSIWICFPLERNEVIRELIDQEYCELVNNCFTSGEIDNAYRFVSDSY